MSLDSAEMKELSEKNILVVGLARNCSKTLKDDVNRIFTALSTFSHIDWLVVESDSSDSTVEELKDLVNSIRNFRYLSLGDLRVRFPQRTARIAHCRNQYIEEIKTNPRYQKIDYILIVDLDGMAELLDEKGVLSCWSSEVNWDVCTANQKGPYYDIWALRHPEWSPGDCWKQYQFLKDHGIENEKALYAGVYSKMLCIPESAEWIEVDSAFGGLAIYKKNALLSGQYIGVCSKSEEICEHVTFHAQLKQKGYRIFINPALIASGVSSHSAGFHLSSRVRRRIIQGVSRFLTLFMNHSQFEKFKSFIKKHL